MVLKVVPAGLETFAAANVAAATAISTAGSANSAEMLNAATAAVGPIGMHYLAAYAVAQYNNLAATLLVSEAHASIAAATEAARASFVAADNT